jgi:hypothetical protein
MAHCFQFVSADGEPIPLEEMEEQIFIAVPTVKTEDKTFVWNLLTLAVSTFGWTPKSLAKSGIKPMSEIGAFLVSEGIEIRTWRERTAS